MVATVDARPLPQALNERPCAPPSTRPPHRWPARLAAVGVIIAALVRDRSGIIVVPGLFVLVVPFEKLFRRHRQAIRRPGLATDLAYGLAAPGLRLLSTIIGLAVGVVSLAWVPGLLLRPLVLLLPPAAKVVLGVVLVDFVAYWIHRFNHELPFLWRFHAVHHSSERLDWVSGLRGHPFDGALAAPPFVLLSVAGFPVAFVGAMAAAQVALGIFLHANVRWRWRPLQRVFVTPEFHHWHHAADARNTNYAALLPLWDIVFGTYAVPGDRRPDRYGIEEPIPAGMVNQLCWPFRDLPPIRRVLHDGVRHPSRSVRHLVRSVRGGLRQMVACTRRPTRDFVQSRR